MSPVEIWTYAYASWNAKLLPVTSHCRPTVVARRYHFVFSFLQCIDNRDIFFMGKVYSVTPTACHSMQQWIVTSLRSGCHMLLFHCGQFFLECRNLLKWLDLLNQNQQASTYCQGLLLSAKFQVIPITGTHPHTHTHHDKVIAISAPPYYIVSTDNNDKADQHKIL